MTQSYIPWRPHDVFDWNAEVTGVHGRTVYVLSASNSSTVRLLKLVLQRDYTNAANDLIFIAGNNDATLANTVIELRRWV